MPRLHGWLWFGLALWLSVVPPAQGGEIGYIEDFALAADRAEPLKKLIPGTDDYYYYHALHYLNVGDYKKVEQLLPPWRERHGHNARVVEITHRLMLLTYNEQPQRTLDYLRSQLNLSFDHKPVLPNEKLNLASTLDPAAISRETLLQREFAQHGSLEGVEDTAFAWLASVDLTPERRRQLLARLARPDVPNLVALVSADLKHEHSGGFGSLGIHKNLLLSQLEELVKLQPELLNQHQFVFANLAKLVPHDIIGWERNDELREAYLLRLQQFVDRLSPAHNGLKAQVLHDRLVLNQRRGKYDRDLFLAYIRLPRAMPYANPRFLESAEGQNYRFDLNANFSDVLRLPPIGNDESLIADYVAHFVAEGANEQDFATWLGPDYLRRLAAETKLLLGMGDAEQLYGALSPESLKSLRERIDIEFAPTNKTHFSSNEPVALEVDIKNVETLLVKIYEINTRNYYLENKEELNTAISLEGLEPNEQQQHAYQLSPLRRQRRRFEFKSLDKPGVYVIDFIGNGKNSRALIRKGGLDYTQRTTAAGVELSLFNDANERVVDGSVLFGGREYKADKEGAILLPYSTASRDEELVLCAGRLCSLATWRHPEETYQFSAGLHVERESLLAGRKASVVIRPRLLLNDVPMPLELLSEVRLKITSTNRQGIASSKDVNDLKLLADQETTYEFLVPPQLAKLELTLSAKVKSLSQSKEIELHSNRVWQLNEIDATDHVEQLQLARPAGKFVLYLLGKNGESRPNRPLEISLKQRDFKEPVRLTLQTNERGAIDLGDLREITSVVAKTTEQHEETWTLPEPNAVIPWEIFAATEQTIELPYLGRLDKLSREECSLLSANFAADYFDRLKLDGGLLQVSPLPPGKYFFHYQSARNAGATFQVTIVVSPGPTNEKFVHGPVLRGRAKPWQPLVIDDLEIVDKQLKWTLRNASPHARVHVIGTRYLSSLNGYVNLRNFVRGPDLFPVRYDASAYLSAREIGDEYRYILDRRRITKFPGNMLTRPGLLLNPWSIRGTETSVQHLQAEESLEKRLMEELSAKMQSAGGRAATSSKPEFANLDFLAQPATVLTNMRANEKGEVAVDLKQLGDCTFVQLLAVDGENTSLLPISLPEFEPELVDLRLPRALNSDSHFLQRREVAYVAPGERLTVSGAAGSRVEAFDTVEKLFNYYLTLRSPEHLEKFRFITRWPTLPREEQQRLYSEHSCHELNFFLSRKDPEFFRAVVLPYIKNKKDKTFLDHWLLGDDVSAYRRPWAYERLNMVERILLGRAIAEERAFAIDYVSNLSDMIPVNMPEYDYFFSTALATDGLEAAGLPAQMNAAKEQLNMALGAVEAPAASDAKPAERFKEMDASRFGVDAAGRDRKAGAKRDEARQALRRMSDKAEAIEEMKSLRKDLSDREAARRLFRQTEKTEEYAENNYYHTLPSPQPNSLIAANRFWRDFSKQAADQPFRSPHFPEASGSFTEIMFALAVLDLPFTAKDPEVKIAEGNLAFTPTSGAYVFHEELRKVSADKGIGSILVSQNYFQVHDRKQWVENQQVDKFVTGEFLAHTAYGCQVILSNPTSQPQKLRVLLQIPAGAMSLSSGEQLQSVPVELGPFATQVIEYQFYFPRTGEFAHYPVQVGRDDKLVGFIEPRTLTVVEQLSEVDRASWEFLSQQGTSDEVLAYLRERNLQRVDLGKIAFRMSNKEFFQKATSLLAARHYYHDALWSYGVLHNSPREIGEFLRHSEAFVSQVGLVLDAPLLALDPVERATYQHLEYMPLVNARAHALGQRRHIVNDRFHAQYHDFLRTLSYRRELSPTERLAVVYYLLLQDRVEEALALFERIEPAQLEARLQYDYLSAYVAMYQENPERAGAIAAQYANYPVARWNKLFAEVAAQVREIQGAGPRVVEQPDRMQEHDQLAAQEPSVELKREGNSLTLLHRNVTSADVNFYQIDLEFLFSRHPFMQEFGGQLSMIRPNKSMPLALDKSGVTPISVPAELSTRNVLVEVVAAGKKTTQLVLANQLRVDFRASYGQLQINHAASNKPLPRTYVKVYAKLDDGSTKFYKDGYTDLRGKFDYASLSTGDLDNVERFSILTMHDDFGATVREIEPPQR